MIANLLSEDLQTRYVGGMRVKLAVTLPSELLAAIDKRARRYRCRSVFIESALKTFLARLERAEAESRDIEIINRRAEALNAEAEDALAYQVPL